MTERLTHMWRVASLFLAPEFPTAPICLLYQPFPPKSQSRRKSSKSGIQSSEQVSPGAAVRRRLRLEGGTPCGSSFAFFLPGVCRLAMGAPVPWACQLGPLFLAQDGKRRELTLHPREVLTGCCPCLQSSRPPRAALITRLHEDKCENWSLVPSSGLRPRVCSLCPMTVVSSWIKGALLECQADWQRFLPGLHRLLFYLATHSSSLWMFQVSWFVDPGPRSQKSCFPHPWTDSHWTWSSNYARSQATILWLRTDGVFSYPSSPAPPWRCFRRSHEHIVVLLSFYLSWLKRQTISVCFYSIFQVLYRVPINKISCLENVRAWKRMQFNQQQYLIF